jgi:hypothetical protein
MVLVMIVSVFIANRWLRRCMPELLRSELLDCGVPICPACGYPLFELRGPHCPECGTPFDDRVRRALGPPHHEHTHPPCESEDGPDGPPHHEHTRPPCRSEDGPDGPPQR